MPWIVKPCEYCKVDFRSQTWKGHERRFCSCSCRQKFNLKNNPERFPAIKHEKRISQCRECGKDYWQRHIDKYFCNTECYLSWKRKNTTRTIRECIICKKPYRHTIKQKNQKIVVCSKSCLDQYYYEIKKKHVTPRFQQYESAKIHGFNCEKCGSDKNIDCHHLDQDRSNNPLDGSNWMRLCVSCHKRTHVHIKKIGKNMTRKQIKEFTPILYNCKKKDCILW